MRAAPETTSKPVSSQAGKRVGWQLAAKPARYLSHAVVRSAGTVGDVTKRKRAEDVPRESEQRYELATAASEDTGIWHVPANRCVASPIAYELGRPAILFGYHRVCAAGSFSLGLKFDSNEAEVEAPPD